MTQINREGWKINITKVGQMGAKTMSRGYILNLRITVNNSETAKDTGVLFSMWTNCKE